MNCDKAREIVNTLMDGDAHSQGAAARQHLTVCAECREWHAGMLQVLQALDEARDDVPAADISAAVMARLPDRHPASTRVWRPSSYPRLVLAWLGASWVAGLLVLAALGLAVYGRIASVSADRIVVGIMDFMRTALGVLGVAARNALSLSEVSARVVTDASPAILSFLALDALFLLAILMLFFGRRRVTRTSAMFC